MDTRKLEFRRCVQEPAVVYLEAKSRELLVLASEVYFGQDFGGGRFHRILASFASMRANAGRARKRSSQ